ncbi:MAG: ribonuclease III [Marinilabiliaceae bacterium]|nr:ribonuclease III [Marinilabiliaceae bacterium]
MFKPLMHIIKLFSLRGKKFYNSMKSVTGFRPLNLDLYKQAFMHKSAMIKGPNGKFINNERLEFLGDAILGSIVAEELYKRFPRRDEGFLTKTRSRIVNRSLLNEIALKMGLGQWIKSQSQIDIAQTSIPGDALEAIVGAVYLDKGYTTCQQFVLDKIITPHVNLNKIAKKDTNYKSILIEWGQKHRKSINFITEEQHVSNGSAPIFTAKAAIDNDPVSEGKGFSKKEAQQNAARQALKIIHKKPD